MSAPSLLPIFRSGLTQPSATEGQIYGRQLQQAGTTRARIGVLKRDTCFQFRTGIVRFNAAHLLRAEARAAGRVGRGPLSPLYVYRRMRPAVAEITGAGRE